MTSDAFRKDGEYGRDKRRGDTKAKWGRVVNFNYSLFDQISNALYSNTSGKDIDSYKTACLTNKAVLFDSILLKVDVITRMEDQQGQSGSTLKLILHYGNKSNQSVSAFSVNINDRGNILGVFL